MRQWTFNPYAPPGQQAGQALAGMIARLGQPRFEGALLEHLHPLVPAASCSIYQIGPACEPRLFMSASRDVPDTTRACWHAYLSGPYLNDRTLTPQARAMQDASMLCHITASEVPPEHRQRVYEAHGVAERVSVVHQAAQGTVFAVNFYRHQHQRAFSDAQIANFEALAPALLALAQKQVALAQPAAPSDWRAQLLARAPALTARELDVLVRLLRGLTQDGIAADLGLGLPTVKTYRNRAFARLGIHFRNELYALVMAPPPTTH